MLPVELMLGTKGSVEVLLSLAVMSMSLRVLLVTVALFGATARMVSGDGTCDNGDSSDMHACRADVFERQAVCASANSLPLGAKTSGNTLSP